MKVVKVSSTLFDVYAGLGWEWWSRCRLEQRGPERSITVVAGEPIPAVVRKELANNIKASEHYQNVGTL